MSMNVNAEQKLMTPRSPLLLWTRKLDDIPATQRRCQVIRSTDGSEARGGAQVAERWRNRLRTMKLAVAEG
jgi:hypothetical protein